MNTNVDKGPDNATNKATSKYLNNTTVNKKPASRIENIIILNKEMNIILKKNRNEVRVYKVLLMY